MKETRLITSPIDIVKGISAYHHSFECGVDILYRLYWVGEYFSGFDYHTVWGYEVSRNGEVIRRECVRYEFVSGALSSKAFFSCDYEMGVVL